MDGGWSNWSDWFPCDQQNSSDIESTDHDQCLCRTRHCNNPAPQNGGATCTGVFITVTNCTVHGGWTPWSPWSACSQTCGMAVKTRRRTCTNPPPAHGGRVCVGQDYSEIYCTNSPPCPAPQQPSRDGQWGPWGPWDDCSASCGGGYRARRRRCDSPPPQGGGQDCQGSHIDYEICNIEECAELQKTTPWSSWVITSNGKFFFILFCEEFNTVLFEFYVLFIIKKYAFIFYTKVSYEISNSCVKLFYIYYSLINQL